MENKEMNKRMELSMEELDQVTGAGLFNFLKKAADAMKEEIESWFD